MKTSGLYLLLIFIILPYCDICAQSSYWSLQACVDTAYKRNIALQQSELSNEINRLNLNQSKAARLPNLNITDGHNYSSGYSLDPYTYQYTTQSISVNNLALNSSVTLFNGYTLLNTIKQNTMTYQTGKWSIEKQKNDILLNVMAAYLQLLMDMEAIEIATAQVKASEEQTELTQKYVLFGKSPEINLLQVQAQLASDELTLTNAENQFSLDRLVLLQLMNVPADTPFKIENRNWDSFNSPSPALSVAEIENQSEQFLPQIKGASSATQAARYGLKATRGAWFPKLTLNSALKTGYSSLRSTLTQNTSYNQQIIGYLNNDNTQPVIGTVPTTTLSSKKQSLQDQLHNNFSQLVGLSLYVPIFTNLQTRTTVSIARVNLANARLNEQQVKNDLRKSIENTYNNLISAEKKMTTVEKQLAAEKASYENMKVRYETGATDATNLLIEKNNFTKISLSFLQARYDFLLKSKLLDFYLGKPLID